MGDEITRLDADLNRRADTKNASLADRGGRARALRVKSLPSGHAHQGTSHSQIEDASQRFALVRWL
jgi:hypothetical protein